MRKTVIILSVFVFLNIVKVLGQESALYRNDGKLLIDTTLSIDTKILDELVDFEKYILPNFYSRLSYPRFCSQNSVYGTVIIKIQILSDIAIFIEPIRYPHIALFDAVKQALDINILKSELKTWEIFKKYPVEFYIPVKFEVLEDTFRQDLKEQNAVLIKSSSGTGYYEKIGIIRDTK